MEKKDILKVNKYGMLEPFKSKKKIPEIIFVPLLAFDKNKNRIGYGKGFYDRYLNKYLKINKNILTVGVAFSFQKYHNLPVNNKDLKLRLYSYRKRTFLMKILVLGDVMGSSGRKALKKNFKNN